MMWIQNDFVWSFIGKLKDNDWHNYIVNSVMCTCVYKARSFACEFVRVEESGMNVQLRS